MVAPTVDEVQARSAFLAGRADAELAPLVSEAAGLVSALTGRDIGVVAAGGGDSPTGCGWEDVPGWLVPVAQRAVTYLVESLLRSTSEAAASHRGDRLLASFSAGPYSESYFAPDVAAKAQTLHPDPAVAAVLWALATECVRRYWLAIWGVIGPPAAGIAVQTVPRMGWAERPRY